MLSSSSQITPVKQFTTIDLNLSDKLPDMPENKPETEVLPEKISEPVAVIQEPPPEPIKEVLEPTPVVPVIEPIEQETLPIVQAPAPEPVATPKKVEPPKKKTPKPPVTQPTTRTDATDSLAKPSPSASESSSAPKASGVDPMDAYRSRVNQAIQAAAVCSMAANNMNMSGKTRVIFELKDAVATGATVTESSRKPMLDSAAILAVQQAKYPQPPAEFTGQSKTISVLVVLKCSN